MAVRGGEKAPSRRKPLRGILAPTSPSTITLSSSICLRTYPRLRGSIPLLPTGFAHRFTARSVEESHFHGSRPYSRYRRKASAVILSHVLTPKILAQRDDAYQPYTNFPAENRKAAWKGR